MMKTFTNKSQASQVIEFNKISCSSKTKYNHTSDDIKYLNENLGIYFETYVEWKKYGEKKFSEKYLENCEQKGKPPVPRKSGGWALTEYGVRLKDITFSSSNLYGDHLEPMVNCRACKLFGLPEHHPLAWVRMYPNITTLASWNGECRFSINSRNDLRVLENHDGQVSSFFETLCINVMKRKYSDIIHPTQKEVLDVYFKKESDPCYICGGHDLVWEKEHFYQRANGFPYYWIDSSGKIQFNILKSCEGCNRGIGGKGSKSPKEYFGEDYNRYCDIYNMPKEPKVTKNGNNRVMVQDMIDDKQYCYDYIETRSDDNKETYLKWFENLIS